MSKGNFDFGKMNQEQYRKIICSPSSSEPYALRFHKPMIEHLAQKFGNPVKLLSVACGYADEFNHLKDYKGVKLYGVDKSKAKIAQAGKNSPNANFEAVDVREQKRHPDRMEGAIALNAVIYCPDKMLSYVHNSLRGGGQAVVNFRDAKNPQNEPFSEDCIKCGCDDVKQSIRLDGKTFELRGMDYTVREGVMKNLEVQWYFQGEDQIVDFLLLSGFRIKEAGTYDYHSPEYDGVQGMQNKVYVYTLEK